MLPPVEEMEERQKIYDILDESIVGGISHVGLPGRHFFSEPTDERICCVDVVSLYVWSMLRCQFPKGYPSFAKTPQECEDAISAGKFGVFICRDISMSPDLHISHFPAVTKDGRRDWTATKIPHAVMTHIDILRVRRGPTWQSKEGIDMVHRPHVFLVEGIFWNETYNPFVAVLSGVTEMKKQMDLWKKKQDPRYNSAMREVCKLIGNSLYGKMLERTKNYTWDEYSDLTDYMVTLPQEKENIDRIFMCNQKVYCKKESPKTKVYPPLQFGTFVLAHSRQLMQTYFDIIGRKNVIATETDSIYARGAAMVPLISSQDNQFCLGKDLGQMDLEMKTIYEGYWLGKKCYGFKYCDDKGETKHKMRLKGVPKAFLRYEAYENFFSDGTVSFPLKDPETNKPYPIVDKDGFSDEPSLILWQRLLFNAPETGIYMRKGEKTVTYKLQLREYDYSLLPKPGANLQLRPAKVFDAVAVEKQKGKKRKDRDFESVAAECVDPESVNYPDLQDSLYNKFLSVS
jgi:hypothetical protein